MASPPLFMSMLVDVEPMMTGVPGLISWVRTTPASNSAFCSARTPARVTGAVEPAIASAAMITGCRASAYATSASSISLL